MQNLIISLLKKQGLFGRKTSVYKTAASIEEYRDHSMLSDDDGTFVIVLSHYESGRPDPQNSNNITLNVCTRGFGLSDTFFVDTDPEIPEYDIKLQHALKIYYLSPEQDSLCINPGSKMRHFQLYAHKATSQSAPQYEEKYESLFYESIISVEKEATGDDTIWEESISKGLVFTVLVKTKDGKERSVKVVGAIEKSLK